jgi:hypothetical protein
MSAFVMDERFFDRLASELFAHAALRHSRLNWAVTHVLELRGDEYGHVEQKIQSFVCDLYELNLASVNARYQENIQPQPIRFIEASGLPKWSDEQLFKHLECLSYQSSEGDCDKSETYQKLEQLIGQIARAIVGASDKYEQAKWDYAEAA